MRSILTTVAVVMTLSFASAALAQCSGSKDQGVKSCPTQKQCDKSGKSSCCQPKMAQAAACSTGKSCGSDQNCKTTCCATPKMKFMVAGEKLCCPRNAEILAKANDAKITYWVGGKEYQDRGAAMAAYYEVLEQYLNGMTQVRYAVAGQCVMCPQTAQQLAGKDGNMVKYCVAGRQFDREGEARAAAQAAHDAIEKVNWTITVDGKDYTCAKTANAMSKKCGSKCEYKVGEKSTGCQQTAQVELAKTRIEAAREAINNTQAKTASSTGTETAAR